MSIQRERARRALRRVEEIWRGLDATSSFLIDSILALIVGWGFLQLLGLGTISALTFTLAERVIVLPSTLLTVAACFALGVIPTGFTRALFRAIAGDADSLWGIALFFSGFLLSVVGALAALADVTANFMSRPLLIVAGAAIFVTIAAFGLYLRSQIEKQKALLSWRKGLTRVIVVVAIAAIAGAVWLPVRVDAWASSVFAAGGVAILLMSFVWWLQTIMGRAHRHIVDFGPSVSATAIGLIVLGIPGVIFLSLAAVRLQANGALPALWNWITLGGVAALALFVASRSWRRADSIVSAPPVSAHRFARSLKILRLDAALRRRSYRRDPITRIEAYFVNVVRRRIHALEVFVSDLFSTAVESLRVIFSVVDFLLAEVLASAIGARQRGRWKRYAALLLWMTAAAAIIVYGPYPINGVGALLAFIVALAVARRWTWIEADRERYWAVVDDRPDAATRIRVGFDQDLADQAIFSFLLLFFVHAPLYLMSLNEDLALFAMSGEAAPTYLDWLAFVGGELASAVPFADWSVIYGVSSEQQLAPISANGQHVVFTLRVIMDLLLLATILQVFASMQRSIRQFQQFTDPGDGASILDPFEERDALMEARFDHHLMHMMRFYDPQRLRQLLRAPQDRRAALGAATLAGYGLASPALEAILYPPTEREFNDGMNALGSRLRPELRQAALTGLRRRIRAMPAEHTARGFPRVQQLLSAAPSYRPSLMDVQAARAELDLMARHRRVELLVRRSVDAAPSQRERAKQELSKLADADVQYLLSLITADDERLAGAATAALAKIGERGDRHNAIVRSLLSMLQSEQRPQVLSAAARTAGALEIDEAGPILARLMRHGSGEVRLAAIRAVGAIGPDVGDAAIKELRSIVDRIVDLRLTTTTERDEAMLALLRVSDSVRARFFASTLSDLAGR